jgi:hypothetical protein
MENLKNRLIEEAFALTHLTHVHYFSHIFPNFQNQSRVIYKQR